MLKKAIESGDLNYLRAWQGEHPERQEEEVEAESTDLADMYFGLKGETPLHLAVAAKQRAIVEHLLTVCRVDVNREDALGQTPLHVARSVDVTCLLLSHGADVNARRDDGRTPLHTVQDSESVSLLLKYGADAKLKDCNGALPTHYACESDALEKLSKAGASIQKPNGWGHLPLHIASSKGNWRAVAKLLQLGSTLDSIDRQGRTALQTAVGVRSTLSSDDRTGRWNYSATIRYLEMWREELRASYYSSSPLTLQRVVDRRACWGSLRRLCRDPLKAMVTQMNLPEELVEEIVSSYLGPFGGGPMAFLKDNKEQARGEVRKLDTLRLARATAVELVATGLSSLVAHLIFNQRGTAACAA